MKFFSILLFLIFLIPVTANANVIIDDAKGIVYIGGYPFENMRYIFSRKWKKTFKNKLYALNMDTGKSKVFITTKDRLTSFDVFDNGEINFIAIVITRGDDYSSYSDLMILDGYGKQIKIIKNVMISYANNHVSWSKDGTKIAYVKGEYINEGYFPFKSKGVWIYDINKDKEIKISDKGVNAQWSKYDGKIYIQNEFDLINPIDISVYDPATKKLNKSDKYGIDISDDGKYYLATFPPPYEMGVFPQYLYNNRKNKRIYKFKIFFDPETKLKTEEFIGERGVFFTNNSKLILLNSGSWGPVYHVFDIAKEKTVVVEHLKKGILGWNKDMTKFVIYNGDKNHIYLEDILTNKRLKTFKIPDVSDK